MDEGFELPVNYNGKELLFPSKLVRYGYSYRIEVDVNGLVVCFERDEERNWRALAHSVEADKSFDKNLLNYIIQSLQHHLG